MVEKWISTDAWDIWAFWVLCLRCWLEARAYVGVLVIKDFPVRLPSGLENGWLLSHVWLLKHHRGVDLLDSHMLVRLRSYVCIRLVTRWLREATARICPHKLRLGLPALFTPVAQHLQTWALAKALPWLNVLFIIHEACVESWYRPRIMLLYRWSRHPRFQNSWSGFQTSLILIHPNQKVRVAIINELRAILVMFSLR